MLWSLTFPSNSSRTSRNRHSTLNDYLNRRYLSQITAQNSGSNLQPVLTLIASKNFGNSSEFRLAQRMTALERIGNGMHIYNARDYSSALAGQDNMILIGSQYSNPWQQLFEARLNFKENPPGVDPGSVINRSPRKGERATYSPTGTVGYCCGSLSAESKWRHEGTSHRRDLLRGYGGRRRFSALRR